MEIDDGGACSIQWSIQVHNWCCDAKCLWSVLPKRNQTLTRSNGISIIIYHSTGAPQSNAMKTKCWRKRANIPYTQTNASYFYVLNYYFLFRVSKIHDKICKVYVEARRSSSSNSSRCIQKCIQNFCLFYNNATSGRGGGNGDAAFLSIRTKYFQKKIQNATLLNMRRLMAEIELYFVTFLCSFNVERCTQLPSIVFAMLRILQRRCARARNTSFEKKVTDNRKMESHLNSCCLWRGPPIDID